MNNRKSDTELTQQPFFFRCIVALFFITGSQLLWANLPLDSILNALNAELDNRYFHYEKKEERLNTLKIQLNHIDDIQIKFNICSQLYEEYIPYQYDSAYFYANKGMAYAHELTDKRLITASNMNLMNCYISGGLYTEAYVLKQAVAEQVHHPSEKLKFFQHCASLHENLHHYTRGTDLERQHKEKACQYTDSVMKYLKPDTYEHEYHSIFIFAGRSHDKQAIIDRYENLLHNFTLPQHFYAIISSVLGRDYDEIDREKAIYFSALSCIYDIRAAVRETTSKKIIGGYLYDKGDIMFASKCIHIALEDANYYNSRQRQIEINSILPLIERERLALVEKQKTKLTIYLISGGILTLALFTSFIIIIKKNNTLKRARQSIQKQYAEISTINSELEMSHTALEHSHSILEKINEDLAASKKLLEESNQIKDMYIVQSLYGKSDYVEQIENLLKRVDRKLATRQYDDLRNLHKEFNLKKMRESMYSSFDKTFLILFPNFMEEINKFFLPQDQVALDKNGNLSPELRIYALIRLGISDSERIAKFLNFSVKTVYSYKAKLKAKAVIPKEEFEYRVMQIKKL